MRLLLIFLAVFFLTGCSEEITAEDMPAIVFAGSESEYISTLDEPFSEDNTSERTKFIDNKGNIYLIEDVFFSAYTPELIKDFEEGKLKDKLKKIGKCEVEEVLQNYKKLLEIMKDKDFELKSPGYSFDVLDGTTAKVGVYYEGGEMVIKTLYKYSNGTTYKSEDERVKEILDWLYDKINQKE